MWQRGTYRWKRFFQDIRCDPGYELALSRDNQRTIQLLTKEFPQLTTKLKHVDVQEDRLRINWMPATGMPADGLMKAAPETRSLRPPDRPGRHFGE